MLIRSCRDEYSHPTRAVFERAVYGSASTHYTPDQLAAWAPEADAATLANWKERRAAAQTVIASEQERVAGFSDLVDGMLLDMLFVDPDFGRRGVGAKLISAVINLARDAGAPYLETHASLTARPVFERSGFVVIAQRAPVIRGVTFANFETTSSTLERWPSNSATRFSSGRHPAAASSAQEAWFAVSAPSRTPATSHPGTVPSWYEQTDRSTARRRSGRLR